MPTRYIAVVIQHKLLNVYNFSIFLRLFCHIEKTYMDFRITSVVKRTNVSVKSINCVPCINSSRLLFVIDIVTKEIFLYRFSNGLHWTVCAFYGFKFMYMIQRALCSHLNTEKNKINRRIKSAQHIHIHTFSV